MQLTPQHAKYYAHDLSRRAAGGLDRLSMALFDAAVDLNPHQIEAALFALHSPLSKGVILADEVGLGKTIEAGIVLCQYWAERKRSLLVICPAALRKQWALELQEKFNLPVAILDTKSHRKATRECKAPFAPGAVVIMSFHYAHRSRDELRGIDWDLVVIDEAHRLRNAYRPSNKVGHGIRWATEGCRKLLLTATPLQNSLLELFGLSTLIDEQILGDLESFRTQYASPGANLEALRQRIQSFCKRTLRSKVAEYIRYTERRTITQPFRHTKAEHELYEAVSCFLQREDSYALPSRQRHLTALILRKLLASSSSAIATTLDKLRVRLEALRDERVRVDSEIAEQLIECEEMETEIDAAFETLQRELDEEITSRLADTRQTIFEHFDEDVHQRLRLRLADTEAQLDRVGRRFWSLSAFTLAERAHFDESELAFDLELPPREDIRAGRYHLISKSRPSTGQEPPPVADQFLYRLSHPLGEHVLAEAKALDTPFVEIHFDVTRHPTKLSVVEALRGQRGYLTLTRLLVDSYEREEYLLFSGVLDSGESLDQEILEKLFLCAGETRQVGELPAPALEPLQGESSRHAGAAISRSLEVNSQHFHEARERLESWADDLVLSAEKALKETKEKIKTNRREARRTETLEEQRSLQEKIRGLERRQCRQRQEIFDTEDQIMEKRDLLIDGLEKRLAQRTETVTLFTIRWRVI